MHQFDIELTRQETQDLHNADAIAAFFTKLGYKTTARSTQTASNLAIPEATARAINAIELIADEDKLFQVYLFEVKSVTVALIKELARTFRNRAGNFLFILTANYEYIDFVLLEREVPEPENPGAIGTHKQPNIVPRRFSVDRRRPTAIHLRVLRRFTWTESDPFGQFDKLRFAYDVAHWSETHFNNRGLFSDYFLTDRLRPSGGELEFPEWREDPKPAYQKLRALYAQASARFAGKKVTDLVEALYKPLLAELGFRIEPEKSTESGYLLRLTDPKSSQLGNCLVYPWARELDRKDENHDLETPEVTPIFAVVDLLAKEKVPWIILTNGRIWRLYSQAAHSRATNYYEVDLDEVLGRQGFQEDIQDSFRYFWLLFREKSFVRQEIQFQGKRQSLSLLDRLLLGSQEYAKELGDSLKERVFTRAFPVLAEGFIEHKRQGGAPVEPGAGELTAIFQGTLTLLYRLLFLLYAESRDLLPVHSPEYQQASLQRLKSEIAERAGTIADETEDPITKAYSTESYALWERLKTLFRVIDKGSEDLNVPCYNGGLFQAERPNDDHTTEAEAARFLQREKNSDRYLARGIDLLARGIDRKTHGLVPVDYKSLGVRQLGSIYEGLLEFKLRIAGEKLGVVKEKDREVYKPFRQLNEKEKSRSERDEKVVSKGRAYLENDKRERKATGSYYTPDHIVKYIVEHAVGPVLQEKFEALRPELREAQRQRRDFFKEREQFLKKGLRPKPIEQADLIGRHIVEKIFDVKVLDPAMGSGHFLVESVDFITDKTLEFLSAFPWNPVLVHLARMRKTIQEQMDEQNIEVDFNRLTDVNLLKRHVLKRCIYGVDLNPMAVELAKVSLWLDCFTLGAPLSFLDHHLRAGNSLIGTTLGEVDAIREAKEQLPLTATSDWQGLTQAVQAMMEIGGMPDITPSQVADSRRQHDSALKDVEVFRRVLDLHTARWFVENPTFKLGGKKVNVFDAMLRSGDLFQWAHGRIESPLAHSGMVVAGRETVRSAATAGRERKFFQWELEFPEVFYGRRPETQNAVERLQSAGFDAVVGNPPYDVVSGLELGIDVSDFLDFIESQEIYQTALRGKQNLYKLFLCRAMTIVRPGGIVSFIVPMSVMGDEQSSGVRRLLLAHSLFAIEAFPQKDNPKARIFPEAKLACAIIVCANSLASSPVTVRSHAGRDFDQDAAILRTTGEDIALFDPENLTICSCPQADWSIAIRILKLDKIRRLGSCVKFYQGEINETNETKRGSINTSGKGIRIVRGANISLYACREASQGDDLYVEPKKFLDGKSQNSKAYHHGQARVGYQGNAPQNNFRRLIAAPLQRGQFCAYTVNYCTQESSELPLDFVLALLNSRLLEWYFRLGSSNAHANEYQMNQLPVPTIEYSKSESALPNNSELKEIRERVENTTINPGVMPSEIRDILCWLSKRIQEIEARRTLRVRSERAELGYEGQQLQDVIDSILVRYYGLSREEAQYLQARLSEML